jgi:hypothetical protein
LPLAFLALLIVPALILEESAQSVHLRMLAIEINWFVWLAFAASTRRSYSSHRHDSSTCGTPGSIC